MRRSFVLPVLPRFRVAALLFLLIASLTGTAMAQTGGNGTGDPPARAARLSYLAGEVGLLPAGSQNDWRQVDINRPLTDGDRLSSTPGARAELELGGAALRIGGDTRLGVLVLDAQLGQFKLTRGTLELSVRQLASGQSYEVDTPTIALVIDRPGRFRVDVRPDGSATRVTAFDGNAEVYGVDGARQDILAGRSYRFEDASLDRMLISYIAGGDAFDAWCQDRDRRYTDSMASQYVPAGMVGAEDLDNYGSWVDEPDYGAVWFPAQVAAGWAPYRFGHWAWIQPWGWTWVDDAPWGFAPFHYGRWAFIRGAWGWLPGTYFGPPVYAPALVAFVGGRHWDVSLSLGGPIGWFPLGPRDIFNPWYHASRRYYDRLNRQDLDHHRDHDRRDRRDIDARIARHYDAYRRGRVQAIDAGTHGFHPRGFSAVPARNFAAAHDVHHHLLQVDPQRLADARPSLHGPAHRPQADPARRYGPRLHALPTDGLHRPVVMRHIPTDGRFQRVTWHAPARPRSFASTRPAIRAPVRPDVRYGSPAMQRGQQNAAVRDEMRPGVSFISRGSEPGRPTGRFNGGLPQVPHLEPLRSQTARSPISRPVSRPVATAPRPAEVRFEPVRRAPPAVFQSHMVSPRGNGYVAHRTEQAYRPPAFRPPPRVMMEHRQAPRAQAQRAQPQRRAPPPWHGNDHRH
ncbi:FecR family protein [Dyella sp. A6]|uniref:FecR family protein n=1 Tax=Dyella aluminiiresistens TaxID=3069105 RepID=UPI002E788869|nr:FecR family protein [Dyella sp. A6]